jgi:PhnB protein
MGSDSIGMDGKPLVVGDNFNLSINADSEKEADEIFAKLSAGGKVEVPMGKAFWGAYFGMLVDKFNVYWMVSYDPMNR